jgi:hypothetical protein
MVGHSTRGGDDHAPELTHAETRARLVNRGSGINPVVTIIHYYCKLWSDVLDCQWIQKLHSFGLLNGSFRPDQQIRTLRSLMRLRDNLVIHSTQSVHHMQKALFEMNVQLSNVISDIVGESGMRILEAILAGERNPEVLATLCSTRIKASRQTVAKSLHGNWREELLFSLQVALDSYRFAQNKIAECDTRIGQHRAQFGRSRCPGETACRLEERTSSDLRRGLTKNTRH